MRIRLALTLLALAAIALLARRAHAACAIDPAFVATHDVPLGCPLIVDLVEDGSTPKVVVVRPDVGAVDVTGTMTQQPHAVSIFFEDNACTGEGHTSSYPLRRFTIELSGVAQGETVQLDGIDAFDRTARIVARGPCPAPIDPGLFCADDTVRTCETEGGGCSSAPAPTGVATIALAIALIGFGWLRRRR